MPYDPAVNGIFDDEAMLDWYIFREHPTLPETWLYFRVGGEPDADGVRPQWVPGESCDPSPPIHPLFPTTSIIQMVAPGMPFAALVGRNNTPENLYPGDQPFNGWHDAPVFPPPSQPTNHYPNILQYRPAQSRLDALYDENTPENQAIRTSPNFGGGSWFNTAVLGLSSERFLTAPAPAGEDPESEQFEHLWVKVDGSPSVVVLYARRGHPLRFIFYVTGPAA